MPRAEVLTFEEFERLARLLVERYGVESIRLTGGEPTVRANLAVLVAKLAALRTDAGPIDVAMTTNGATLPLLAARLRDAGLRRVNISLDTLDRERFATMTRRDELPRVLDGIAAALEAGFDPGQDQRRRDPRRQRRRDRRPGDVRPGARPRGAVHRVDAPRCRRRLGPQPGRRPGRDRVPHRRRVPARAGPGQGGCAGRSLALSRRRRLDRSDPFASPSRSAATAIASG